ncbi:MULTISPECIES: hypothetical protein [unclassified Streptomyces]|uniref:hypothetical protein n=1 Tax=unclassified Streptomyces TaxID=2593676 RepID=UPI002253462A|nr:hypothetical protein [Streptomyces sp. NBC_00183]MCX5287514.1 hypothetical protein [Streptomyces sp. NBC_00183]
MAHADGHRRTRVNVASFISDFCGTDLSTEKGLREALTRATDTPSRSSSNVVSLTKPAAPA